MWRSGTTVKGRRKSAFEAAKADRAVVDGCGNYSVPFHMCPQAQFIVSIVNSTQVSPISKIPMIEKGYNRASDGCSEL
jgi:hypothetical protein